MRSLTRLRPRRWRRRRNPRPEDEAAGAGRDPRDRGGGQSTRPTRGEANRFLSDCFMESKVSQAQRNA
jgi:hypothetical protein